MEKYQTAPRYLALILVHSVPLICLVTEYTMNQMPFVRCHHWVVSIICILYIIVNIVVTKLDGPIYPDMKWDSLFNSIYPFGIWIVPLISFFMIWKFDENYKKIQIEKKSNSIII